MIYDNTERVTLDLQCGAVIPPLTPCDPNRRKYTEVDVLSASAWVLGAAKDVTSTEGRRNYGNALAAHTRATSGAYVIEECTWG